MSAQFLNDKLLNCDNGSENNLEILIEKLKNKISERDKSVSKIKYPKMLIKSLLELESMIGMKRLKNSIALQVMRLIFALNAGQKNKSMLNTILYGSPGVGKTKVGIILAKIWFSLGYLQGREEVSVQNSYTPENSISSQLVITVIFIILWFMTYIIQAASFVYKKLGLYWLSAIIGGIILVGLFLYWSGSLNNLITQNNQYTQSAVQKVIDGHIDDRHIITVVSRRDFVADYVGQTAGKTKNLLMANLGKVIFIDEAYSLLNDSRDPFGLEALTTLNLFMSENPGSTVVIFAGYKDLMQNGIFKAQPGLPRRCMWHFECDGYDGYQLSEIFFLQVSKANWKITNKDEICHLIQSNSHLFPSYGGDTERLLFFAELEASKELFMSPNSSSSRILSFEHIQKGIQRLKDNNIHKHPINSDNTSQYTDPNSQSEIIKNLLKTFSQQSSNSSNTSKQYPSTQIENLDISH